MYIFKTDIDAKEYDQFVETHPYCNLLQSYNWANIKNNWNHIYTGVYENDKLVATGLVLIRKLPFSFTMFYLPRRPVLDWKKEGLLHFYFKELKKNCPKQALFIHQI